MSIRLYSVLIVCHIEAPWFRRRGMTERMDMSKTAPDGFRAALSLERYVGANVDQPVLHLIKLRASMTNGCAYCIDMHSGDAAAAGESLQRLFALAAWWESPFFTREERAALALTDAVTDIGEDGVPDQVWEEVTGSWSEREVADLLLAIASINVLNRIAISTRKQPRNAAAA